MDNQHRKIAGYRELPDIDMMNAIKAGPQMEELLAKVAAPVQEQRKVSGARGRRPGRRELRTVRSLSVDRDRAHPFPRGLSWR